MLEAAPDKPLYLQLVEELETLIRDRLAPHDKLQSERELTEAYGVSRMTVRLALQELESRGLVYRKQGKGTYVAETMVHIVDLATAYSFTEQVKLMGKTPKTQILSFVDLVATAELAKVMDLAQDARVYALERLRLADGVPMMLEISYIPVQAFPGLSQELLAQKPLYDIFAQDYKQAIKLAEEECYASLAQDYEAEWLQIEQPSPVLYLERKSYNAKNKLIEYTLSTARADQFRYKITHKQPKKPLFANPFTKKK